MDTVDIGEKGQRHEEVTKTQESR